MKIVIRTLVILTAALLVVAGLNAFAHSSLGQSFANASPGGMRHEGGIPPEAAGQASGSAPAGVTSGERPSGATGRGEGEGHGASLFGLVEVGKNLAITAVSIVLVALGARMLHLNRRDEQHPASPEQPAPRD